MFTPVRMSYWRPGTGGAAALDEEKPKVGGGDGGPANPPVQSQILPEIGINPGLRDQVPTGALSLKAFFRSQMDRFPARGQLGCRQLHY